MEREEARCCAMSLSRCQVLVEIGRGAPLSLVELAGKLGLEKSTVSRLVDALVDEGLVERAESADDRRYVALGLTAEGKELFLDIETRMNVLVEEAWERVPPDRREGVLESLEILADAFRGECCR
jgi:DNA-binding MarR family transcriptional regulator